jgi:PAS domain S-box-containing protein
MMTRILIVEDERIVAEDIQKSLEKLGYTVCGVASSGKKALKKVKETTPDIILMDIVLRGDMDGIETAQEVRSQFGTPVVYLTAHDDDKTIDRAKITEPYGYLLKPFNERELHTTIEMALHKHQKEKKVKESLQWLATTLTSIEHGVITTDTGGAITFMNPVAEALTGWSSEQAVQNLLHQVFCTTSGPGEQDTGLSQVLQRGTVIKKVNQVLTTHHGALPVNEIITPLKDEKGIIMGAVVVFRDITEEIKAENLLKESVSRYHGLFEDSPLSLWEEDWSQVKKYVDKLRASGVTDFRTYFGEHPKRVTHCMDLVKLIDVNKAALDLHGAGSKEELLGNRAVVFTDKAIEIFTEELIALAEGSQHFHSETVHKTLSGKTKHIALYITVPPGYEDTLEKVLVSMLDITERTRAELELRELFEASKLINSTMDMDKVFRFISDSVQKLVEFDYFVIFLVSNDGNWLYPAYTEGIRDTEQLRLPYGQGVIGQCIEAKKSMLLDSERALEPSGMGPLSEILIPLIIRDECVGAFYLSKKVPDAYRQEDLTVLKPLSEVVSSAIWNSRLYEEIQTFNRELEARIEERSRRTGIILDTRQNLQAETNWEKGLMTIVESMGRLGFERSGVYLVDPLKKKLEFHFGAGFGLSEIDQSVSLKDSDYFGVKCVLEKETIHVEDFATVKGKQVTSDSPSFVWVPIIVRGEAFAALAADNIKSKRVITEEDVKNLEILAGMCAAFIDRTRVLVEPAAESSVHTELRYNLDVAEGYIVKEKKPKKCFNIFIDLVTHGIPGFIISRTYPEKLKRKYKLLRTPILWLSKSEVKNAIDPTDLSKLVYIIEDFTKKSEESVILLDGVEYLITQTGFENVLKYLHELKDLIVMNNSRLIIPLHSETLSLREYSLLERDFTVLEPG